jgi:AAA+ superfamily predicted ATPase
MDDQHAVIASLRNAVAALPDDLALRMHLASLLLGAGHRDEAVAHLGAVLQADPGNTQALSLLISVRPAKSAQAQGPADPAPRPSEGSTAPAGLSDESSTEPAEAPATPANASTTPAGTSSESGTAPAEASAIPADARTTPADASAAASDASTGTAEFNWAQAEAELQDVLPPMFISPDGAAELTVRARPDDVTAETAAYDADRPALRLADVAGMADVKARLEAAFLAPMRNPDLRKLYGKSLRGGLLLYGPPGCGKTFIARAVAGELGARFMAISFADVVDMYIGSSERNIRAIFATARENAPCVVFLDEVDAIGQKRSQLRSTPMRSTVNQLLLELDDVTGANEGVFVLAATNHPWDVDSALRRPGRLDRTLLVLPPDDQAREAVFRFHLRDRPVAGIQLASLAARTDGFSAADIAHICESAAELALLDSARTGRVRMIGQDDLLTATGQVRPSLGPWFESARNVALFANEGGSYDDLAAYLKRRKLL